MRRLSTVGLLCRRRRPLHTLSPGLGAVCQPRQRTTLQNIQEFRLLLLKHTRMVFKQVASCLPLNFEIMPLTSVHVGARATFAPPASEPRISCRSSYHASNSAPHKGPTPGGYGGGRCSHSAVISPVSHNSKVHGHTVHAEPGERVDDREKRWGKSASSAHFVVDVSQGPCPLNCSGRGRVVCGQAD